MVSRRTRATRSAGAAGRSLAFSSRASTKASMGVRPPVAALTLATSGRARGRNDQWTGWATGGAAAQEQTANDSTARQTAERMTDLRRGGTVSDRFSRHGEKTLTRWRTLMRTIG